MSFKSAEIFDVVDASDRVIGQAPRAQVHAHKWLHRAVHIIVRNSRGEVYLQKRSMKKDLLPGVWTTSASGHVDSGESYDVAAARELHEELGIDAEQAGGLGFMFKHPACRHTGQEFVQVYEVCWDGQIRIDPEEIDEGQWYEPEVLDAAIRANRRAFAPSFRLIWGRVRTGNESEFLSNPSSHHYNLHKQS